jgi:peptidyl-prolyl cis-trans isomerase B (cyclophilin B)
MVYPQYFHKRGALSAARLGDDMNPSARAAAASSMWCGKDLQATGAEADGTADGDATAAGGVQQPGKAHREEVLDLRRNRDREGLQRLQDQLADQALQQCREMGKPAFTDQQVQAYTTLGGTPFLDNQYTVFGEVEEGLDVVGRIQEVETMRGDRPTTDVTMHMEVVEQ